MDSTQFVVQIRAFRKLIHDNCTEVVEQGLLVDGVFHFGNFGKVVELKSFTLSKKDVTIHMRSRDVLVYYQLHCQLHCQQNFKMLTMHL